LQKRVFELENPIKWLNEEEIIFCRKIYERIINHERMIELNDDLWKKSKEKILYNKLIENDGFVQFLNLVVEHKRDKDFLTNINKTWYAVDWKLI
jgi:ABC-type transport system involved in Fe-S cluster assembly fused permease/ATPase subunit